ncbi:class E sortase, partial [Candidatus Peregrinibacteria bacterium]|nr:class E sortase [Candidatus Peregrinibacteria bacterium]
MKKKSHNAPPAYSLHIDRVPHIRSRAHKVGRFVWDKVQFFLVSAGVFIIMYIGLNWQALLLNAEYAWNKYQGKESPLERLLEEQPQQPEKLLPAFPSWTPMRASQAQASVPRLNIEVHPPDMRIIIPRINQNLPVVGVKNENLVARKWDELEADIQKALRNGVIHYPGTALPGENGNIVITGHSSYYAWDPGRFKDVFALLHDVRLKDRIVVYFNQKKFVYEVTNRKIVLPKDVDVLATSPQEQLTLITCTPIGTNLKRLVLTAKLVEK